MSEIRRDDWGWLVRLDVTVVGGSWDVVVGGVLLIGCGLTIFNYISNFLIYFSVCSLKYSSPKK